MREARSASQAGTWRGAWRRRGRLLGDEDMEAARARRDPASPTTGGLWRSSFLGKQGSAPNSNHSVARLPAMGSILDCGLRGQHRAACWLDGRPGGRAPDGSAQHPGGSAVGHSRQQAMGPVEVTRCGVVGEHRLP